MLLKPADDVANVIQCTTLPTRQHQHALEGVQRLIDNTLMYGRADGLVIVGPTGAGKSTIADATNAKHPIIETDQGTRQLVVTVSIPPKPDARAMGMTILSAMNRPFSKNDTQKELDNKVLRAFKALGTVVLQVDETQDLVERGTLKQHVALTNWFKWLMNTANVSIVLIGLPYLTNLLHVNSQLRRRFSEMYVLTGWSLERPDDVVEFVQVLKSLISKSGFDGDFRIIANKDLIKQLLFATNGTIAHVVKVAAEAVRLCMLKGGKVLEAAHFEAAFKAKYWRDVPDKRNPFSKHFDEFPLTAFGEPFYQEEIVVCL